MTDMQGRLMGKRMHAPFFLSDIAGHGAEGCNYLLAVDVEMNTVQGYEMSSWDTGYGDFVFKPDMSSLRPIPWLERTALVVADLEWHDGAPVLASPRQILRRQLDRLAAWTRALVHRQVQRARRKLVPHPLLVLGRERQPVSRRPQRLLQDVRALRGGTAGRHPRAGVHVRTQHQLLQALRLGLVRA